MSESFDILSQSLMITVFVFVMMLTVDYINVLSRGKMAAVLKGGIGRQYLLSSLLGSTPGCLGAFMNVAFYTRGLLSFGAIVGGMIATSGDEAYVMLALFPRTALLLFGLLFVVGIVSAWATDKVLPVFRIAPREECRLAQLHLENEECRCFDLAPWKKFPHIHPLRILLLGFVIFFVIAIVVGFLGPSEWGWERTNLSILLIVAGVFIAAAPDHYLKEHIWAHILKSHLWRVFLWTFFALLFLEFGLKYWNLEAFVKSNIVWVLLVSALVGLIPESGPHLVFVTMFAGGIIPFSVLVTSSIVQDGHGMLPLFSHSVKDSLLVKVFNLFIGLSVGAIIYALGTWHGFS